jgi:hypothetical protein
MRSYSVLVQSWPSPIYLAAFVICPKSRTSFVYPSQVYTVHPSRHGAGRSHGFLLFDYGCTAPRSKLHSTVRVCVWAKLLGHQRLSSSHHHHRHHQVLIPRLGGCGGSSVVPWLCSLNTTPTPFILPNTWAHWSH